MGKLVDCDVDIVVCSFMPDFKCRSEENVPGKYYVDDQCLDCDLCCATAPMIFVRNDDEGYSYVNRQPETEEERLLCEEAVEGCPCEAVGDDGDENDWASPIEESSSEERVCKHCLCSQTRSFWGKVLGFFKR